jgi:hypothetical protein
MPTSSASAARAFKAAFLTAVQTVVDTDAVLVSYGHPGAQMENWDDAIALADVRAEQAPGPISTNRSRNEDLTLTVWISSWRKGGPESEKVASDAAYGLLEAIEHHIRVTDTTVGDTVMWCFLTDHESAGVTPDELLDSGRTIEIKATFTARVRITGA